MLPVRNSDVNFGRLHFHAFHTESVHNFALLIMAQYSNSRPLRGDPSSYEKTGIPCGNPKRYQSRGVIRMCQDGTPYKDQSHEIPIEDIETEGDRQLQALLKKQLDTTITLEEQLTRKKHFSAGSVYKPLGEAVSGAVSLSNYQAISKQDSRLEELQRYGLTQDEIQLKLEAEENQQGSAAETSVKRKCYGKDPVDKQSQMEAIERKIAQKKYELSKPDTFTGAKKMSRHEMDLERAISHRTEKNKLQQCLITEQAEDPTYKDLNHPIYHLDSILEEALDKRRKAQNTTRRKAQNGNHLVSAATCATREQAIAEEPTCTSQVAEPSERLSLNDASLYCSKCGIKINTDKKSSDSSTKCVVCCRSNEHSTHATTSTKCLTVPVESIPEEVIQKYRITLEEIREIPRFKDYDPGQPSKVLFLKNLSPKVTEEDLVALFIRFQKKRCPKVMFRLMTGRMRGQAFVTFDSEDTASDALQLVNGYQFKGKPIIIQYGKKPG